MANPLDNTRKSDEAKMILASLTHEWISFDSLFSLIKDRIPPGKGLRVFQRLHPDLFEQKIDELGDTVFGKLRTDVELSPKSVAYHGESAMIDSGRRQMINSALANLVNGQQIQVYREDDNHFAARYYRKNFFTADELDALIKTQPPVPENPSQQEDEVDDDEENDEILLSFDLKTAKSHIEIKGVLHSGIVQMKIRRTDSPSIRVIFSPPASDFLSDQLGIQAIVARDGDLNPSKMIDPSNF